MAAWKSYVDGMQTEGALNSGIFVIETGATCAVSDGFNVTQEELQNLRKLMKKEDARLQFSGVRCIMTRCSDEFIQGKSHDAINNGDKVFYHCEVTKLYFVVVSKSGANERDAVKVAQHIANHLRSAGQ